MYKFEADGQTIKAKFWIINPTRSLRVMEQITTPFYQWRRSFDGKEEPFNGEFILTRMHVDRLDEIRNGFKIIDLVGDRYIFNQFAYQHKVNYPAIFFPGPNGLTLSDFNLYQTMVGKSGAFLFKMNLLFPNLLFKRLRYYHNLQDE